MPLPFKPTQFVLLLALLGVLVITIQIQLLTIAFDKLGLSPGAAFVLLFACLFGSAVNVPLFHIRAESGHETARMPFRGLLLHHLRPFRGRTLIAANVGGGVIPVAFSAYLISHHPFTLFELVGATALVSLICYVFSRPVPGLGIGMPVLVAPLAAAGVALATDPVLSAPLAYICGTLGVLIGADLMRLNDIRKMGTPIAAIGGAGTFDGIFLTGIVAVLLA
jgi:uncharacterized membrane protein